jgi:putative DNA primase/helicase
MEFLDFCAAHGIIIQAPPPLGQWKRYPTTDHPKKRNGAVKFMGDHAFIQNHALDTEVSVWKGAASTMAQKRDYAKIIRDAEAEKFRMQAAAASNAASILKQCQVGKHEYLKSKGFPEEEGNVFVRDGEKLLIIPMRVGDRLVGCQIIDEQGGKKFLFGQRTSNAEFCFNNKGHHILCEGYATALSVRLAMKALKRRYIIHVCFSAGNMKKIASTIKDGLIVADNDKSGTGERVAKEIGLPYWISDQLGEDANDFHKRTGLFRFSQNLNKLLNTLAPIY